jgi:hypothetical protein
MSRSPLADGAGAAPTEAGPTPRVADALDAAPEADEWTVNPWRERARESWVAAIAALALCTAVARFHAGAVLTLALSLAAVGALAPLLSPSRCRVDDDGVARRGPFGWQRRHWSELRRATVGARAVLLSPYATAHWLDTYRGLVLPLPRDGRAELVESLRRHLDRRGL